MIKSETGKSAHDYIHSTIIDKAKELIFVPKMTVSEIAYEPGFKYPQHFKRLFKNRVRISPTEYRFMNKNSHN
ncbi:helix-turn-helix domain-containing protein [Chitinophaga sancti]|uniref:Helix-turn-helix domain-containing protein n=1 Tax=Chitinophaga sancti TaxID=1004 RepID=A0ABZ0XH57_9BACT|nr:helix-turn-helix domain-containing protein [Chitinophaga sancti]WQD64772.1 helix-turn-helix domain-containing protein [Chitinophaga sancti]WQG89604.1 helix-turn-helix domain-containing protein [Chitinophaga sancti]